MEASVVSDKASYELARRAIKLFLTQRRDPQANGRAEATTAEVARLRAQIFSENACSHAVDAHNCKQKRDGTKINEEHILPSFGVGVNIRKPPAMKLAKCEARIWEGIYLDGSHSTDGASIVGILREDGKNIFEDRSLNANLTKGEKG